MSTEREHGITLYNVTCANCDFGADQGGEPLNQAAHRHVEETGHVVTVERVQRSRLRKKADEARELPV